MMTPTTDLSDTTDQETRLALADLSCSDLSDALDRLGIPGQCFGIRPVTPSSRLVGQAFTVRYGPVGQDPGTVGDYVDDLPAGAVVCLDNAGREDATVWGDLLTSTAARNRLAGTVIDGVCRDVNRAFELDYPVFARGSWMRTGKDRVQVDAVGEPITVGSVRVVQGDWIVGDGDGVVCIPSERVLDVIEVARQVHNAEERIREALDRGVPLRDARRDVGYHSLQTRRD
jgi:4-hydroxy-4-methyl-2-oxoglutarate aldolase